MSYSRLLRGIERILLHVFVCLVCLCYFAKICCKWINSVVIMSFFSIEKVTNLSKKM